MQQTYLRTSGDVVENLGLPRQLCSTKRLRNGLPKIGFLSLVHTVQDFVPLHRVERFF